MTGTTGPNTSPRFKLGVDVGGTFTDISLLNEDSGELFIHKVPSVPHSPSDAVANGVPELMKKIGHQTSAIRNFVHGTTIGLNAVLQGRGAKVALVVSKGNRDILELARLQKKDIFDLHSGAADPLVSRDHVIEIDSRTLFDGTISRQHTDEDIRKIAALLEAEAIESVAICLLHSHANPIAEDDVHRELLDQISDCSVSSSHSVWPEIREYERASVAILNAYVQPIMKEYLSKLRDQAQAIDLNAPIFLTRSNGGVMGVDAALEQPVHTLLSGPAAGVVGAAFISQFADCANAITLDIGGTSAEVSIVRQGEPIHSTEAFVGDFPFVMPSVDVFSVGAGGGSIAKFDDFGLLKVGPESAGAVPGPACYSLGGTEPTVTDAYLICGYLNPENFVGGTMKLDMDLARSAMAGISKRLGLNIESTAESILQVATSNMSTALAPLLTKRGINPSDYSLIAYGGAGATHGCFLADDVQIVEVIIPPSPGTLCALGASVADLRFDGIRTVGSLASDMDDSQLNKHFADMEVESLAWLEAQKSELVDSKFIYSTNMRYLGQAFDVEVPISKIEGTRLSVEEVVGGFHRQYEMLFKRSDENAPVEVINLRLLAIGVVRKPNIQELVAPLDQDTISEPEPVQSRPAFFDGKWRETQIFDRASLQSGQVIHGPAIIEQFDTTTVVTPSYLARVNRFGLINITRKDRS